MENKKYLILVDGSNVAHSIKNSKSQPRIHNLEVLIEFLEKKKSVLDISYEILTDPSLYHQIDNKERLNQLIHDRKIKQCPSRTRADDFIISYYNEEPETTIIISNDNFTSEGFSPKHPWSLCKFMFINGRIIIPAFIYFENSLLENTEVSQYAKANAM
ncbi:MAG: NYN domain-containing protein [Promethearchaeota archaeon]